MIIRMGCFLVQNHECIHSEFFSDLVRFTILPDMNDIIFVKQLFSICFFAVLSTSSVYTQDSFCRILIQPYLQDAQPNSIKILWSTQSKSESTVEWGISPELGNIVSGRSILLNFSDHHLHEVDLTGLKRFTRYYYRVKCNQLSTDIYSFRTPPFPRDHESFNIVAISDMQYDSQNPEKFKEVVDAGILRFVKKEYGSSLSENLALVLIPGDLVENGAKYHQWKDHFFDPAQKLFSEVPVYPVLGNHERNSRFYFDYFALPENGTPAYAEHWWYKDYGNVRIIGLNSNDGYRNIDLQKRWLKELLSKTDKDDEIDFVFAQLHHPHKSELWIPGEIDFAGEVVALLEEFTTRSGKPSIHFFGHTHGYSRGQSRDHKHLWINVASAGGAIDNWGEFEGRDYDEFSVTQDEYGFVMVEVDGDETDPKLTVKRISRGNEFGFKDNELSDNLTVWKNERKPDTPQLKFPVNETVDSIGLILKASAFSSTYADALHGAAHWQIATDSDFIKPVFNSWKQHENWYYKEDRQKEDDLTDEKSIRLRANKNYFWRVRYRDQNLNWSDWSEVASFMTK